MITLAVSWIAFGILEYTTRDVKIHKMLCKSCVWVFIPFMSLWLNNIKGNTVYTIGVIYMFLLALSGKKTGWYSKVLIVSIGALSVMYVIMQTPLGKMLLS